MLSDFLEKSYLFSYKLNNFTDYDLKRENDISITSDFLTICENISPIFLQNFLEINIYEGENSFSYLGGRKYNFYILSENFNFQEIEADYKNRLREKIKKSGRKNFFSFFKIENQFEQGIVYFYLGDYKNAYEKFKPVNYEMALISLLRDGKITKFSPEIREKLIEQLKVGGDKFLIMRIFLLNYFFEERIENLLILFSYFMDLLVPHKSALTVFLLLLLLPMMHTQKYSRMKKYFLFKLAVLYFENNEKIRSEQILSVEKDFLKINFT